MLASAYAAYAPYARQGVTSNPIPASGFRSIPDVLSGGTLRKPSPQKTPHLLHLTPLPPCSLRLALHVEKDLRHRGRDLQRRDVQQRRRVVDVAGVGRFGGRQVAHHGVARHVVAAIELPRWKGVVVWSWVWSASMLCGWEEERYSSTPPEVA